MTRWIRLLSNALMNPSALASPRSPTTCTALSPVAAIGLLPPSSTLIAPTPTTSLVAYAGCADIGTVGVRSARLTTPAGNGDGAVTVTWIEPGPVMDETTEPGMSGSGVAPVTVRSAGL